MSSEVLKTASPEPGTGGWQKRFPAAVVACGEAVAVEIRRGGQADALRVILRRYAAAVRESGTPVERGFSALKFALNSLPEMHQQPAEARTALMAAITRLFIECHYEIAASPGGDGTPA